MRIMGIERKKRNRKRIRERKRRNIILMLVGIKKYFFCLASSYSTQPKIAAYYSSKAKIISYTFTIVEQFLYFDKAKIAVL